VVDTVAIAGVFVNLTIALEISQGMAGYIAYVPDESVRRALVMIAVPDRPRGTFGYGGCTGQSDCGTVAQVLAQAAWLIVPTTMTHSFVLVCKLVLSRA